MRDIETRISQARGETPADLVLRGGRILDLVTGNLIDGDVAICGQVIVGTGGRYDGAEVVDVTGLTLVPGFVDAHLHVESSLVTPFEFDRCVTPRGVTTAICDPHEIANVLGAEGVRYFQDASRHTLMDLRVQIPSCVPSTHMETAGARLDADDLADLMSHPSGIGLAEMMNYPGVVHRDPGVMAKLSLFAGRHVDGHAPRLTGRDLDAYAAAGISTEHEATTAEEALEKLSKGMRILIREGSVSKDLAALQPVLTTLTAPWIGLCTDDRNPLDIFEEGHLDHMIRRLIAEGTPVQAAYRAASLSGAQAFGLTDRGLIAPGWRADIVALGDLADCDARLVVAGGRVVTQAGFDGRQVVPPPGKGTVKLPTLSTSAFRGPALREPADVIGINVGRILTDHLRLPLDEHGGDTPPDAASDIARIAVVERHGKGGGVALGHVKGMGIAHGAIASTVCHDHHNLVIVGMTPEDMHAAALRIGEIGGGLVAVEDGKVLAELPLPIAGLMSDQPFEAVCEALREMRVAAGRLGTTLPEPFLQLAFLALPVIPSLKITDLGLVDVESFRLLVGDNSRRSN